MIFICCFARKLIRCHIDVGLVTLHAKRRQCEDRNQLTGDYDTIVPRPDFCFYGHRVKFEGFNIELELHATKKYKSFELNQCTLMVALCVFSIE